MMRSSIGFVSLLLLGACGAEVGEAGDVATMEQSLSNRGIVTEQTVTLSARGDTADVYGLVPPARLRRFFRDRFPVVVFLQGALVPRTAYSEVARQIARQGFVVVVPDHFQALIPGQPPLLFTDQLVLNDALDELATLDADPASPFYQIVDTSRSAVAGHSLGGAVGLFDVAGVCTPPFCFGVYPQPASLRAGVFYGTNLVEPTGLIDLDTSAIPTALVQGSVDGVAVPAEAQTTFELALDGTKALITIDGANHFGLTDNNVVPGAVPDPNAQTLDQATSIRLAARWMGLALRAYVRDDPVANALIFDAQGALDPRVSVQAAEAAP